MGRVRPTKVGKSRSRLQPRQQAITADTITFLGRHTGEIIPKVGNIDRDLFSFNVHGPTSDGGVVITKLVHNLQKWANGHYRVMKFSRGNRQVTAIILYPDRMVPSNSAHKIIAFERIAKNGEVLGRVEDLQLLQVEAQKETEDAFLEILEAWSKNYRSLFRSSEEFRTAEDKAFSNAEKAESLIMEAFRHALLECGDPSSSKSSGHVERSDRSSSEYTDLVNLITEGLQTKQAAIVPKLITAFSREEKSRQINDLSANAIIDGCVLAYQAFWEVHVKRQLRPMASTLRKDAKSPKSRLDAIGNAQLEITLLKRQLGQTTTKIREAGPWNSAVELQQQCQSFMQTVMKLAQEHWYLGILQRAMEPAGTFGMAGNTRKGPRIEWLKSLKATTAGRIKKKLGEIIKKPFMPSPFSEPDPESGAPEETTPLDGHSSPFSSKRSASPTTSLNDHIIPIGNDQDVPRISDQSTEGAVAASIATREGSSLATYAPTSNTASAAVIDLTGDDDEVFEVSDGEDEVIHTVEDPHLASVSEIESWAKDDLINEESPDRLLVKTVHAIPAADVAGLKEVAAAIIKSKSSKQANMVADKCHVVLNTLRKNAPLPDNTQPMHLNIIKLFMVATHRRPDQYFQELTTVRSARLNNRLQIASTSVANQFRAFVQRLAPIVLAWKPETKEFAAARTFQNPLPTVEAPVVVQRPAQHMKLTIDSQDLLMKQVRGLGRLKAHDEIKEHDAAHLQQFLHDLPYPKPIRVVNPGADLNSIIAIPCLNNSPPLMEHQVAGVQFIWREMISAVSENEGCLLFHEMGLGKTRTTISFLDTLYAAMRSKHPSIRNLIPRKFITSCGFGNIFHALVVAPASLVGNWDLECHKWRVGDWNPDAIALFGTGQKVLKRLRLWNGLGGLLIISYEQFTSWMNPANKSAVSTEAKDMLLNRPSIVICDEVQRIRNFSAQIHNAIRQINTNSRLGLTGTPISSKLEDLFSIVDWAAPGYLGSKDEFDTNYRKVIDGALYANSAKHIQKLARTTLYRLTRIIEPKVHRRDISIIADRLPKKTEFIIAVPLTPLQETVYNMYIDALSNKAKEQGARIFGWLSALAACNLHPQLLRDVVAAREAAKRPIEDANISDEDGPSIKKIRSSRANSTPEPQDVDPQVAAKRPSIAPNAKAPSKRYVPASLESDQYVKLDEASMNLAFLTLLREKLAEETHLENFNHSHKLTLLLDILVNCRRIGEKVIIFSQYVRALDLIAHALNDHAFRFFRMDGTVSPIARPELVSDFNGSEEWAAFLISTFSGNVGLNITGANRIITVDHCFNPADENQAISRAHRLGQQRNVTVYHLASAGTFEKVMQNTQVYKAQLAARAVDSKYFVLKAEKTSTYIFKAEPVSPAGGAELEAFGAKDPRVLGEVLRTSSVPIVSIHQDDTYKTLSATESSDKTLKALNSRLESLHAGGGGLDSNSGRSGLTAGIGAMGMKGITSKGGPFTMAPMPEVEESSLY